MSIFVAIRIASLEDTIANIKGRRRFRGGRRAEVPHKWADWLHNPCRLGSLQRFGAGDKVSSGQQVGGLAT